MPKAPHIPAEAGTTNDNSFHNTNYSFIGYKTMPITLIGYRATGKTTLAQMLAERLGWGWIDADVEIERRAGKTIAEIFAEDGEPVFRDLEADVTMELCGQEKLVLAAGGGAPLRPESRRAMRQSGKVVWLQARPETVLARMTGDATTAQRRPELTNKSALDEIVHLMDERESIYRETAHFEVDVESKTPRQIADEIIQLLELAENQEDTP